MKPGIAANVKPRPTPTSATDTHACQNASWLVAKKTADTANTTEPNGMIERVPNRRPKAGVHRLESNVPTDSGTSISPAATVETPNPKPVDVGSCTNTTIVGANRYIASEMMNPDTSA